MHPLTELLFQEHRQIEKGLQRLGELTNEKKSPMEHLDELRRLHAALKLYLGDLHHGEEEELLFPALASLQTPMPGGPQCTYFMGLAMEWDPVEPLRQAAKAQGAELPKIRLELNSALEANPMFGIPLGEHQAGHYALERIGKWLQTPASIEELRGIVSDYLKLMRQHIQKEDQCLFVMADELLSEDTQTELVRKAQAIRIRIGLERIEEAGNVLSGSAVR